MTYRIPKICKDIVKPEPTNTEPDPEEPNRSEPTPEPPERPPLLSKSFDHKPQQLPNQQAEQEDDEPDEPKADEPDPFPEALRAGVTGEYLRVTCPYYSIELKSHKLPLQHLSFIAGSWASGFNKAFIKSKTKRGYV